MENISFNQPCQSSSALYQACADGVPYLVLVKDGCCEDNVLKYINMEDGSLSTTRPANLLMGACEEELSGNSNICFEFTVNSAVVTLRVATVNGVVTYYENNVEVTNATRIGEIDALIEGATADNVICCPNCQTIPDGQVCYEITTTKTYQAAEAFDLNPSGALPVYIPSIVIRNIATDTDAQTVTFSPPLQVWNGTTIITTAAFTTALNNAGYLAKWQLVDPRIDRFEVRVEGSGIRVLLFDEANAYTNANRIGNHVVDFSNSPTGEPVTGSQIFGTYTNVTSTSLGSYKSVTANGVTDYYKDDVLLTTPTDIEAAQTAILTATPDNVVCCPDCGGGGGGGTLTNTLAAGHIIGTYTDGDGVVTNIRETVTSIETNADGSFTYTNEDGTETIIPVTPCKSFYEKQTFTATAGQTTFTLLTAPSGDIHFSRNGSTLSDLAAAVSGTTVTYVPAQNNNEPLLANDRIDISYVYTICTGTATVVDGSETKVTAGTNTTVTGTGTVADPYIVSATGGSTAGIGDFAVMNTSGGQSVSSGVKLDWTNTVQSYGTNVVPNITTDTLLLKAGYIYEVETDFQMQFPNSGSFFNYGIYSGTTAATQATAIGTKGKVRPNTETFGNGMFDVHAQAFVVATVDTYVSLRGDNGNGTISAFEGASYFKAKAIGKI